ncbi:MAG: response regulator [Chloroflexi bacterium]|nr:response regulator [Chloroflexota bacterium]
MKVLVIDGDRETRRKVSHFVQQRWLQAQVINTGEGQRGLRLVKEQAPDLVLLDMELPDTDSFELLRMVRDISTTWIVMLTRRDQAAENTRFLEEGADVIVVKPFSSEMLSARIQTVLRRTRAYNPSSLSFAMRPMRAGERTSQSDLAAQC